MARIMILKAYKNKDGSIGGMFSIPVDDLKAQGEKATRIELIELEGQMADIKLTGLKSEISMPSRRILKEIQESLLRIEGIALDEVIKAEELGEDLDLPLEDEKQETEGEDNEQ